jgi:hypothetical protein
MFLDFELVDEAKRILNTNETTETVHRALEAVVRQARLKRLTEREFHLSAAELERLRTPRRRAR